MTPGSGVMRNELQSRIPRRLVALDDHRLLQRLGGGFHCRHQFEIVLERVRGRHEYMQQAAARLHAHRRPDDMRRGFPGQRRLDHALAAAPRGCASRARQRGCATPRSAAARAPAPWDRARACRDSLPSIPRAGIAAAGAIPAANRPAPGSSVPRAGTRSWSASAIPSRHRDESAARDPPTASSPCAEEPPQSLALDLVIELVNPSGSTLMGNCRSRHM